MTVQLIQFTQPSQTVFQFNATLVNIYGNSSLYSVTTPWNVYACRYYVQVTDFNQNVVAYVPLTPSPDDYSINLLNGLFTTKLVYRTSSNNFEVGS